MVIVALSDIHLGHDVNSNAMLFRGFLEAIEKQGKTIAHLVLVGDILDFWRRRNEHVLMEFFDILHNLVRLKEQGNIGEIHYTYGNHDFFMNKLIQSSPLENKDSLISFERIHTLQSGGTRYHFIHGHQIEFWPILDFYEEFSEKFCYGGEIEGKVRSSLYSYGNRVMDILSRKSVLLDYLELSNTERYSSKFPDNKIKRLMKSYADPMKKNESESEMLSELEIFNPKTILNEIKTRWNGLTEERKSSLENKVRTIASKVIDGWSGEDCLIFGHTHHQFKGTRVANTGSWTSGNIGEYLTIGEKEVTERQWTIGSELDWS